MKALRKPNQTNTVENGSILQLVILNLVSSILVHERTCAIKHKTPNQYGTRDLETTANVLLIVSTENST